MTIPLLVTTMLLGLAWFTLLNLAASAISWTAAAFLQRTGIRPRAGMLLAIRLFPASVSLLLTSVLFLPSHWMREARDVRESFGATIYVFAGTGLLLIGRAFVRAAALARADRRLRAREHPCTVPAGRGLQTPAYDVETRVSEADGVPGLALAGLCRTRILIGQHVAAALTADELDVAIAHEMAHRAAADNVKRWAFHCAPDLFGQSKIASRLERDWHAAAESMADARASGGSRRRALDLASALVKVARLTIDPSVQTVRVWSTFNDPTLLRCRVERLMSGAPPVSESRPARAGAIALGVIAVAAMLVPVVAGTIHAVTEAAVALLP